MKRFLTKCLVLLLAAAACVYLLGMAYRGTTAYRNGRLADETERFTHLPERADIAVVGSSHGMLAFLYPPEDAVLLNLCMSAQIPQYDLRMLREHGDRLPPGAVVIVTMSYITPFWTEPEANFLWKQGRYYDVLSAPNIIDADWTDWALRRFFPVLTTDIHTVLGAFLKDVPLSPTQNEASGHRTFDPTSIPEDQARVRNDHIDVLIAPTFPECSSEAMEALEDALELCQERGWQAVLVTPPYLEAYNDVFSQWSGDLYPRFYHYVGELTEKYGVPYLDYSHDPDFAQRYDLYKDIDHLNLDGARILDQRLWSDLKDLLGEGFPFSEELSDVPFDAN